MPENMSTKSTTGELGIEIKYQYEGVSKSSCTNAMAEPSKFGATLNSGYFRFLSISHSGEALE